MNTNSKITEILSSPYILPKALRVMYLMRVLIDHMPKDALSQEQVKDLLMAAVYHDIGKSTWRDDWYTQPRYLIKDIEWSLMKAHPIQSANILKEIHFPYHEVIRLVEQHHERPGCRGYPYQIEPDLASLMLASCDVFAGCSEDKPYREKPLTKERAFEEVEKFAPDIILQAFRTALDNGVI